MFTGIVEETGSIRSLRLSGSSGKIAIRAKKVLGGTRIGESPSAKLLLTTGFCGGFTTFSTFMNEGAGLMKEENYLYMMLYLFGSLALGLIAVLTGHYLAKMIA